MYIRFKVNTNVFFLVENAVNLNLILQSKLYYDFYAAIIYGIIHPIRTLSETLR